MSLEVNTTDAAGIVTAAMIDRLGALRQRALIPRPSFAERLTALDTLSDLLLARDLEFPQTIPTAGLAFVSSFLRRTNLEQLVARELAHPAALDRFVRIDSRKSLRVIPRGVACHWVAGNVPLLGVFSWALSAVVGNVNVVRVSTRADDLLSPMLELLSRVSPVGFSLSADTLVLRFPRDDDASHRAMSAVADVRVAWGGREAVESVLGLPARWDTETVILGPRMSLAVIDPDLVTDRVLSRLATDVAYFDQQACSSPQWVFVRRTGPPSAFDRFVNRFTEAFSAQAITLGRHTLDCGETYQVELDRARVLLEGGQLHRDGETRWTVAVLDAPNARVACTNRFVQVIPYEDVSEVVKWIPENVQTAVTLLPEDEAGRFTAAAALQGVCRFPRPGEGNHFENPWDGIALISRLTRWVIRTEAAPEALGQS